MIKLCVICGKPFEAKRSEKTCSSGCSKENYLAYQKAYQQTPEYKARRQTTQYKAYQKAYQQTPEYKAYEKARRILHPSSRNFFQLTEIAQTIRKVQSETNQIPNQH